MSVPSPSALFDLTGRTACVTGASAGLGRRAADVLLAAGAKVVGVARRADALDGWARDAGDGAAYVVGDLSQRDAVAGIAERVSAAFGRPTFW
jgi:NAD(P)-dependent dehydrogenase (short-subunit alcohol dehydrogenase family)